MQIPMNCLSVEHLVAQVICAFLIGVEFMDACLNTSLLFKSSLQKGWVCYCSFFFLQLPTFVIWASNKLSWPHWLKSIMWYPSFWLYIATCLTSLSPTILPHQVKSSVKTELSLRVFGKWFNTGLFATIKFLVFQIWGWGLKQGINSRLSHPKIVSGCKTMAGTRTHNKLMRIPPLGAEASLICLHYIKTKQNSNPQRASGSATPQIQGRCSIH